MALVMEIELVAGEERLREAFVCFGDELIRALSGLLGDVDDARDVAQETFLKCWRTRDRLDEVRDLKAWIFRVGLNAARDLRRNAWRQRSRPLIQDHADHADHASENAQYRETVGRLEVALGKLRPEEREVFLLRHQGDMTYEQIARHTGAPLGTVKTRMRMALARLKRAFQA